MKKSRSIRTASVDGETVSASEMAALGCCAEVKLVFESAKSSSASWRSRSWGRDGSEGEPAQFEAAQ